MGPMNGSGGGQPRNVVELVLLKNVCRAPRELEMPPLGPLPGGGKRGIIKRAYNNGGS